MTYLNRTSHRGELAEDLAAEGGEARSLKCQDWTDATLGAQGGQALPLLSAHRSHSHTANSSEGQ